MRTVRSIFCPKSSPKYGDALAGGDASMASASVVLSTAAALSAGLLVSRARESATVCACGKKGDDEQARELCWCSCPDTDAAWQQQVQSGSVGENRARQNQGWIARNELDKYDAKDFEGGGWFAGNIPVSAWMLPTRRVHPRTRSRCAHVNCITESSDTSHGTPMSWGAWPPSTIPVDLVQPNQTPPSKRKKAGDCHIKSFFLGKTVYTA